MRKCCIAWLCLLLMIFSAQSVQAEEIGVSQAGFRAVYDDAACLISDSRQIEQIKSAMLSVTEYANCAFVTSTGSGTNYMTYAWNYGLQTFGSQASWTVFLIDMGSRQLVIRNSNSLKDIITSADSDTITDNVYRMASRGNYAGCAAEAFAEIYALLQGGAIKRPMKYISAVLIAVLLGVLIVFLCLAGARNAKRARQIRSLAATAIVTGGAVFLGKNLIRKVHHSTSSHGGFGGGGHGGGGHGGGGGGSGGSHGF